MMACRLLDGRYAVPQGRRPHPAAAAAAQVLSWLHSRGLALGGFTAGQLLLAGPAGAWLTLLAAPVAAAAPQGAPGALLSCGSHAAARPDQGRELVGEAEADLGPPAPAAAVPGQVRWCGAAPPPLGLLQAAWCAGVLPNLDYLLWLNTLAGERGGGAGVCLQGRARRTAGEGSTALWSSWDGHE